MHFGKYTGLFVLHKDAASCYTIDRYTRLNNNLSDDYDKEEPLIRYSSLRHTFFFVVFKF